VSSSGAPRNIDGMKSRNVWVIAIDVMKIRRRVVGRLIREGRESIDRATRFMWMPGISPVKVPVIIPRRREVINVIIWLI